MNRVCFFRSTTGTTIGRRLFSNAPNIINFSLVKNSEPTSNFPFTSVAFFTLGYLFISTLPANDFYPTAGYSGKKQSKIHSVSESTSSTGNTDNSSPPENTPVVPGTSSTEEISTNSSSSSTSESHELLKSKFVLVGGGTASYSALLSIQDEYKKSLLNSNAPQPDILIISNENHLPYMRPPLSKECWFSPNAIGNDNLVFKDWSGQERSIFFTNSDSFDVYTDGNFINNGKPKIILNTSVVEIDGDAQVLVLDNGRRVKYEKVLLATGGKPKVLKWVSNLPDHLKKYFSTYRSVDDMKRLHDRVTSASSTQKSILVYGGGFLGSELACALSMYGKSHGLRVTQVFAENGNMGLVFPGYLSEWTTKKVEATGVDVRANSQIIQVTQSPDEDRLLIKLSDGTELQVDHVILSNGITPNTEFISNSPRSGLELDMLRGGGIIANAEMEARKNIFVAGDVLSFYDVTLGRRRIEHHDHAILSGRVAGRNMVASYNNNNAGVKPYQHQSMFWSDLGPSIGYEAVGILDATLPTVGIWTKASEVDTPKAATESADDVRVKNIEEFKDSSAEQKEKQEVNEERQLPTIAEQKPTLEESEKYGKGVVLYLRDEQIVGALLWNMFGKTQVARDLIQQKKKVEDVNLLASMFKIHEDIH